MAIVDCERKGREHHDGSCDSRDKHLPCVPAISDLLPRRCSAAHQQAVNGAGQVQDAIALQSCGRRANLRTPHCELSTTRNSYPRGTAVGNEQPFALHEAKDLSFPLLSFARLLLHIKEEQSRVGQSKRRAELGGSKWRTS